MCWYIYASNIKQLCQVSTYLFHRWYFINIYSPPHKSRSEIFWYYQSKVKEVKEPLRRWTFEIVFVQELSPDGNNLPSSFLLSIKSKFDSRILLKSRYLIGGHRVRVKDLMVHSTKTTPPQSVSLLSASVAMLDFDICRSDVKQAYFQPKNRNTTVYHQRITVIPSTNKRISTSSEATVRFTRLTRFMARQNGRTLYIWLELSARKIWLITALCEPGQAVWFVQA